MSLRSRILLVLGSVAFVLSAILVPSGDPAPHASSGPAKMPSPTASAPAESVPSAKLIDAASPALLLDETTVSKYTATTFKRTSADPTSGKYYYERSVVFTSQDKEYVNTDKKPVTLTLVTYVDDTKGTYWKSLIDDAKGHNAYYRGIYVPEGNAGDDAYLSHDGKITAHKGQAIVRLIAKDDGRQVLTDAMITTLMIHALGNLDV